MFLSSDILPVYPTGTFIIFTEQRQLNDKQQTILYICVTWEPTPWHSASENHQYQYIDQCCYDFVVHSFSVTNKHYSFPYLLRMLLDYRPPPPPPLLPKITNRTIAATHCEIYCCIPSMTLSSPMYADYCKCYAGTFVTLCKYNLQLSKVCFSPCSQLSRRCVSWRTKH